MGKRARGGEQEGRQSCISGRFRLDVARGRFGKVIGIIGVAVRKPDAFTAADAIERRIGEGLILKEMKGEDEIGRGSAEESEEAILDPGRLIAGPENDSGIGRDPVGRLAVVGTPVDDLGPAFGIKHERLEGRFDTGRAMDRVAAATIGEAGTGSFREPDGGEEVYNGATRITDVKTG